MGIIRTALNVKAAPIPGGGSRWMNWNWDKGPLVAPGSSLDYRRMLGTDPSAQSIAEATILWIARNFPQGEMVVTKWDKEQDLPVFIRQHPLTKKLRRPNQKYDRSNGGYSGIVLWMGSMVSWSTDGNFYWIVRRNPDTLGVMEYWYCPHTVIEPRNVNCPFHGTTSLPSLNTYVDHYDFKNPDGSVIKLDPLEVFHCRYGLDPENPLKGRSPLRTAYRELFVDEMGSKITAALLANLGVPGIVIAPAKESKRAPTKDERDQIEGEFIARTTGDKIGLPIMLSGSVDVHQFGFNPDQLSLAALRDIPEERVTALLGVPASVVGFGSGLQTAKVGATMSELRDQAWENCLMPTGALVAAEADGQLLPDWVGESEWENYSLQYDISRTNALLDAFGKKSVAYGNLLKSSALKRGEVRSALGYRTEPDDNIFIWQAGVVSTRAGQGNPPAGAEPPPGADASSDAGKNGHRDADLNDTAEVTA